MPTDYYSQNNSVPSTNISIHRNLLQKKKLKNYFSWMEKLTFLMLYLSMLTCLAWTNYNMLLIFFGYYIWIQRHDLTSLEIMKALDYFSVLYDTLFVFIIFIDWDSCVGNDPNDQKRGIHKMAVILFWINYTIRGIKIFLIHKCSEIFEKYS